MFEIAERFKSIGVKPTKSSSAPSALFGSAEEMSSSIKSADNFRISIYPFISEDKPEIAMGIAICLSYFLEQYAKIRIYRIIAKIESDSESEDIKPDDYQFLPSDWEFKHLDDNVVLSGQIDFIDNEVLLTVTIDTSLINDDEIEDLRYTFSDLIDLVNHLNQVAFDIVSSVADFESTLDFITTYSDDIISVDDIQTLLEKIFYWNLDIYLTLWGVEWLDDEIIAQYQELVTLYKKINSEFSVWCLSLAINQVMQIGLDSIGEILVPHFDDILQFSSNNILVSMISNGLVNLGYIEKAIALLEEAVEDQNDQSALWLNLINSYMSNQQLTLAIEANQRAIEAGLRNKLIYWRYAQLLQIANSNDIYVQEVLFIDPDEINDEASEIIYEIILTLISYLELVGDDSVALYTLLLNMIEVQHPLLWQYFDQLFVGHIEGKYHLINDLIDRFSDLYDIEPAYKIITRFIQSNPNSSEPHIYLSRLGLIDGQVEHVMEQLDTAENLLDENSEYFEDIQRLRLIAQYEDFEFIMSETLVMLNANKTISEETITFLETTLDIAPNIPEIYILLIRCYLSLDDYDAASDLLKEAKQNLDSQPQLIYFDAYIQHKLNNTHDAIGILNDGLQQFPNSVDLLTYTASLLIDDQQVGQALIFIERAEIINASHPSIWQLRKKLIGKNL